MKRNEIKYLLEWKNSSLRKPLVIRGARQVGKTWLMREFGMQEYEKYAYVNFESNSALKSLFSENFNIDRILTAFKLKPELPLKLKIR